MYELYILNQILVLGLVAFRNIVISGFILASQFPVFLMFIVIASKNVIASIVVVRIFREPLAREIEIVQPLTTFTT